MLVLAFLLAQAAAATPTATPAAAPPLHPAPLLGRSDQGTRPKTLSEHAAEMKAKGASARRVSFDDVATADPADAPPPAKESGGARPKGKGAAPASPDAAAAEAQKRMDRAVARGLAVPEHSSRRESARREWDEAAEACRRTPGCVPQYRDDARFGENKPLKTDGELIEDIKKRGFSEPHTLPPK